MRNKYDQNKIKWTVKEMLKKNLLIYSLALEKKSAIKPSCLTESETTRTIFHASKNKSKKQNWFVRSNCTATLRLHPQTK